jgi:hypothetical protein
MSTRSDAGRGSGRAEGAPALTCGNAFWNGWNTVSLNPGDTPGTEESLTYAGVAALTHTHAHGHLSGSRCSTRSSSNYLANIATERATMSSHPTPPHLVLAHHVRRRREALGITVGAAVPTLSDRALRKVEHPTHVPTSLHPGTFAKLDSLLDWPAGTAEGLHTGRLLSAPISLNPSFREWVGRYRGADNKYGDVAMDLVPDDTWPNDIETTEEMEAYLDGLVAADSFREVTLELFRMYLAEKEAATT